MQSSTCSKHTENKAINLFIGKQMDATHCCRFAISVRKPEHWSLIVTRACVGNRE
jgi:hypothetical protein